MSYGTNDDGIGAIGPDGPDPAGGEPVIDVDDHEWRQVVGRLGHALGSDERTVLGKYGVVVNGGRRRWVASDSYRLMSYDAGSDDGGGSLLIPERLLDAWPLVSAPTGRAVIVPGRDAEKGIATLTIKGPGGSLTIERDTRDVIDFARHLDPNPDEERVSFTLDVAAFTELMRIASTAPPIGKNDGDREWPFMFIEVGDGSLVVEIDWGDLGPTRYSLPVDAIDRARVSVNPTYLKDMIAAFEPGEVRCELPTGPGDMLVFRQGPLTGLLMPMDPSIRSVLHAEEVLASVFGQHVLHTDGDGDYPISTQGVPVYARLSPGDPTRLIMFAGVLADVDLSEELLVELNQINAVTGMAKARWDDGLVVIQGELIADTADPAEVVAVYERITSFADGLGTTLAARFGGRALQPGEDVRWSEYEQILLLAELTPGEWLPLNGPDATKAFPFEDSVFVISASDPHGVSRPYEVNANDHGRLASDLTRVGAGFVRARARDEDGSERDAGFLVWDVSQQTVLAMANEYAQEVFFELSDSEISVVGVTGDRRSTRARNA